jgi:hypothetical protein
VQPGRQMMTFRQHELEHPGGQYPKPNRPPSIYLFTNRSLNTKHQKNDLNVIKMSNCLKNIEIPKIKPFSSSNNYINYHLIT